MRNPKAPVEKKKKKDDDWLSPLISAAGGVVGTFIGGPVGGMIGAGLGSIGGKVAASAAGMEETGVTQALNTATNIGQGVSDAAGLTGSQAAAQQLGFVDAPQAPAVPAAAAPSVAAGQQMAMQVASDGMNQSSMARSPTSQLLYDVGFDAPRGMQALPSEREQATGAMGYVPTEGLVYEATPEAAKKRRDAMMTDFLADRERRFMEDPFYASIREREGLDDYRQQLMLTRREVMADELRRQAGTGGEINSEFPLIKRY
mgnify:CR=1 FL=1